MQLAVHFARLGPYHFPRMDSACAAMRKYNWSVTALEIAGTDETYAWDRSPLISPDYRRVTVFPDSVYERIRPVTMFRGIQAALDKIKPDAVAIAGWGSMDAIACLRWCRKNRATAILMTETRAEDGRRVNVKEALKRLLISKFDGALCGGKAHRDYLAALGMPHSRIFNGYDVVDNDFFTRASRTIRQDHAGASDLPGLDSPVPFFLASSRFIPRKNLLRLIRAYAIYMSGFHAGNQAGKDNQASTMTGDTARISHRTPWRLVILGDGQERPLLEKTSAAMHLEDVSFPGFQQIQAIPHYLAMASAFIHPALQEPWGLVINEAMACGLPVLCSRNAGAAELVASGLNGFLFDPGSEREIADMMLKISLLPDAALAAMGKCSLDTINSQMPTSAFGAGLARILQACGRISRTCTSTP